VPTPAAFNRTSDPAKQLTGGVTVNFLQTFGGGGGAGGGGARGRGLTGPTKKKRFLVGEKGGKNFLVFFRAP